MRLSEKVAVVTGGANGIGAAYCTGLAREGARVWIADIDATRARELSDTLVASGFTACPITVDVSNETSVQGMLDEVLTHDGAVDILVNNAGICPGPDQRTATEDLPTAEWDQVMAVNLRGMFLCSRHVIAPMRRQGSGVIVNVSSGTWYIGSPTRIHYVVSKAGVVGFTRSLARELGSAGIRVNAIAPGGTLSERDPSPGVIEQRRRVSLNRALPRVEVPEDLVGTLLYLVSEESAFVTGQTIVVDGGTVMS